MLVAAVGCGRTQLEVGECRDIGCRITNTTAGTSGHDPHDAGVRDREDAHVQDPDAGGGFSFDAAMPEPDAAVAPGPCRLQLSAPPAAIFPTTEPLDNVEIVALNRGDVALPRNATVLVGSRALFSGDAPYSIASYDVWDDSDVSFVLRDEPRVADSEALYLAALLPPLSAGGSATLLGADSLQTIDPVSLALGPSIDIMRPDPAFWDMQPGTMTTACIAAAADSGSCEQLYATSNAAHDAVNVVDSAGAMLRDAIDLDAVVHFQTSMEFRIAGSSTALFIAMIADSCAPELDAGVPSTCATTAITLLRWRPGDDRFGVIARLDVSGSDQQPAVLDMVIDGDAPVVAWTETRDATDVDVPASVHVMRFDAEGGHGAELVLERSVVMRSALSLSAGSAGVVLGFAVAGDETLPVDSIGYGKLMVHHITDTSISQTTTDVLSLNTTRFDYGIFYQGRHLRSAALDHPRGVAFAWPGETSAGSSKRLYAALVTCVEDDDAQ